MSAIVDPADWETHVTNLMGRFPTVGKAAIVAALVKTDGDAGNAATELTKIASITSSDIYEAICLHKWSPFCEARLAEMPPQSEGFLHVAATVGDKPAIESILRLWGSDFEAGGEKWSGFSLRCGRDTWSMSASCSSSPFSHSFRFYHDASDTEMNLSMYRDSSYKKDIPAGSLAASLASESLQALFVAAETVAPTPAVLAGGEGAANASSDARKRSPKARSLVGGGAASSTAAAIMSAAGGSPPRNKGLPPGNGAPPLP